ncbi:MAG: alanine--tRNA ligase-related protein [Patescibacteria group bacterium]
MKLMGGNDIRRKYLEFMAKQGHAIIPSAALVPENDPTTLFTGSGMQPLVPYLMGETHPKGVRLANSQKCFRAEDISEVGDNRHTTFFEMLGNWSLGDYFKQEQLPWFYSFLVDEIGLDPERIYVTVFQGDESAQVPRDTEAAEIWQRLFSERGVSNGIGEMGSEEAGGRRGMQPGERIFYYDASKNWWSRAGRPEKMPVGEIGGPDSEVFYDFNTPHNEKFGAHCHPNCDCGRFLEIGNSVFMEYLKTDRGFEKLPKQNVDFGGGLERIAAAKNGDSDVFKIDLLSNIVTQIETLSNKKYSEHLEAFRVITDHIRGAAFMIGDGVLPSNSEQGYFVRRLLRRAVRYADMLGIPAGELANLSESVIATYARHYTSLTEKKNTITKAIAVEEEQFRKTLSRGLKEFEKIAALTISEYKEESLRPDAVFDLVTTHGFPLELVKELAEERGLKVDEAAHATKMQTHQALSRAGAEQKFKGGLADHSEKVVQYHTTTHLLLAALRNIVGEHVHQAGSNITGERLRFDFTHGEKIERATLDKLVEWVNNAIKVGGEVTIDTMPKSQAEADPSVEGSFWDRYPDEVKVYTVRGNDGTIFSRELCGGPHVQRLSDIKGVFKITKEESSSAGVRRIKAVLE